MSWTSCIVVEHCSGMPMPKLSQPGDKEGTLAKQTARGAYVDVYWSMIGMHALYDDSAGLQCNLTVTVQPIAANICANIPTHRVTGQTGLVDSQSACPCGLIEQVIAEHTS